MKRWLSALLMLPCLAQAETPRERMLNLASQAEAILAAMELEPTATCLNPMEA